MEIDSPTPYPRYRSRLLNFLRKLSLLVMRRVVDSPYQWCGESLTQRIGDTGSRQLCLNIKSYNARNTLFELKSLERQKNLKNVTNDTCNQKPNLSRERVPKYVIINDLSGEIQYLGYNFSVNSFINLCLVRLSSLVGHQLPYCKTICSSLHNFL